MTELALKALVDEYHCIGCSKCLRVCPTDAIVGTKKMLHTIMPQLCTSCSRCVEVCPTNCISLATPGTPISSEEEHRLIEQKTLRQTRRNQPLASPVISLYTPQPTLNITPPPSAEQRKQRVADAIARAKAKKQLMQNK
ncbi:RnfABCDGE type electron transport complex subunit B [Utexia brackfieldae]|uniref:RnfABCDGE type electron transport complex subunit B n=1 Tax=Utexia brackfieldae TaxID=3074108 RepID=UPI00370D1BA5